VLDWRKWCRRSRPKGRLAHARHASAEPSSLFTIVAWSPWSLAVWLRDCDLLYAIYPKSNVLPNPSVGLLYVLRLFLRPLLIVDRVSLGSTPNLSHGRAPYAVIV
jgi:hypothetical protein